MANSYNLLGFLFRKKPDKLNSFAPPPNDDSALIQSSGGVFNSVIDLDGIVKSEIDLITKYREIAQRAEVDGAITEIVYEGIVSDDDKPPVAIVTDKVNYSESVKQKIVEEFKNILNLLDFNNEGQDWFRKWYVDGRLAFHIMIDEENPREGIKELRYIDPRRIKPVIITETVINKSGVPVQLETQRYFLYNQFGTDATTSSVGVKVTWDSICFVHSGLQETNNTMILSHLQKALKPANLLSMEEDAVVILRLSRSAERLVFYVDTGNMPTNKAEQYLKNVMNRFRNKVVFDATTGELQDAKRFLSMQESYWLPRREGGKGTEVVPLPAGANLGEMADVDYFRKKLYQSLNVPVGRLNPEGGFSLGRTSEITRDEIKFGVFIKGLRNRFSQLFDQLLSTQLRLKGIINEEDWLSIRQDLYYDFLNDTYFEEMKTLEILRERFAMVDSIVTYAGKYISHQSIRKLILKQTEDDMKQMDEEMAQEKNDPRYQALDAMNSGGMGMTMDQQPQQIGMDDPNQPQEDGDEEDQDNPQNRLSGNVEKLWSN